MINLVCNFATSMLYFCC